MEIINNRVPEIIDVTEQGEKKYLEIHDSNINTILINESQFSRNVVLHIQDSKLVVSYNNQDICEYTLVNTYIDIDKINNYIIINLKNIEPDMQINQSYPIIYLDLNDSKFDINNSFNLYNIKINYKVDKFNTITLIHKSYFINNDKDMEKYNKDLEKYYRLIQDKEKIDKIYKIHDDKDKYFVLLNGVLYYIIWVLNDKIYLSTLKNDIYEQSISITLDELVNNPSTKLIDKKRIVLYNDCVVKKSNVEMRQIQEYEQKYYNFRNTELYKLFKLNQNIINFLELDYNNNDNVIKDLCKNCISLIMEIYDDDSFPDLLQYSGLVYIINGTCFEFTKEYVDNLLKFSKDTLNYIPNDECEDDITVL